MGREPECATVKPCTDNVAPDSQTSSGPAMVGPGGSDDGASWPHVRNLDTTSAELSYPTLLEDVLDGGVLHVAWTFGRRTIRYARLAGVEAWLTAPS